MTHRKVLEYWTETKQVIDGQVKVTVCCCAAPGHPARACAIVQGNKTPCRCFCHSKRLAADAKKLKGKP